MIMNDCAMIHCFKYMRGDDKTPVAGKSTLNRLEPGHELDKKSRTGTAKSPGMPGGLKSFSSSTWWMSLNQLRLYFPTIACIFFVHIRKTILQISDDETRSMSSTIRLRILKVSVAVKISVRRVWISLPESFPWRDIRIRTARGI